MKKVCFALVLILTLLVLCSCRGYVNNYSATVLITSCHGNEASMKFDTFKGTYSFKLRRDDDADHTLNIEASLAEGEMKAKQEHAVKLKQLGVAVNIICEATGLSMEAIESL